MLVMTYEVEENISQMSEKVIKQKWVVQDQVYKLRQALMYLSKHHRVINKKIFNVQIWWINKQALVQHHIGN